MVIKWKDERYIEKNKARETECVSGQVTWTEKGQFWIPYFYVPNALSLVSKKRMREVKVNLLNINLAGWVPE